ncbi:unnamed protein product [Didymodactylos carnosus]|uniref:C3H1-type domain-containing protein n=1 Tax=Didymodactylos carnosus TaxID=1234261 RepID=A0A813WNY2_9BILA|nr:unnamed protein product [Didymodactylos carnosus]CAF0853922.1 unnamed protein product [Didymodactylos carnosus]CAF3570681.1 unnamed protein product [Didymodactylos carnosus]CAF3641503.1 unnamed protein product [Didymodactylos carnosus]
MNATESLIQNQRYKDQCSGDIIETITTHTHNFCTNCGHETTPITNSSSVIQSNQTNTTTVIPKYIVSKTQQILPIYHPEPGASLASTIIDEVNHSITSPSLIFKVRSDETSIITQQKKPILVQKLAIVEPLVIQPQRQLSPTSNISSKDQDQEDQLNESDDSEVQSLNGPENPKYKTELCRNFTAYGCCSYSSRCQFARMYMIFADSLGKLQKIMIYFRDSWFQNLLCSLSFLINLDGLHELKCRTRHPKYKTEVCRNHISGYCKYGSRCQFIHRTEESKARQAVTVQKQEQQSLPLHNLLGTVPPNTSTSPILPQVQPLFMPMLPDPNSIAALYLLLAQSAAFGIQQQRNENVGALAALTSVAATSTLKQAVQQQYQRQQTSHFTRSSCGSETTGVYPVFPTAINVPFNTNAIASIPSDNQYQQNNHPLTNTNYNSVTEQVQETINITSTGISRPQSCEYRLDNESNTKNSMLMNEDINGSSLSSQNRRTRKSSAHI